MLGFRCGFRSLSSRWGSLYPQGLMLLKHMSMQCLIRWNQMETVTLVARFARDLSKIRPRLLKDMRALRIARRCMCRVEAT